MSKNAQSRLPWRARCGLLLAMFFAGSAAPAAFVQTSSEYVLKAVLMFNFTQFVEWPAASFPSENAPFVIGVLGRDPFGDTLDETARSERVGARPIQIVRYSRIEDVGACQILFVSQTERNRLRPILAALKDRPTLTVSDYEGFAVGGGMMSLLKQPDGKISLRINLGEAKAAGLTISAKLLRLAEVVSTTPP